MRTGGLSWRIRLTSLVQSFRDHLWIYRAMLAHPRTPWISRVLLGIAVVYALSPIDLIPDFLPIVGHLDDALIVPILVGLALCFIPTEVKEECRLNTSLARVKGADEFMGLKWNNIEDIALALREAHPEVNPVTVRFTDLRDWIAGLAEWEDDIHHSNESKLEAIQMAWIEECNSD